MTKKDIRIEVSAKSTKEQILAAYNEVSAKLVEKQIATPQEEKKHDEARKVVSNAANNSSDSLLTELGLLKSKTIKQVDNLSEQLLCEFQKLSTLREAIVLEQKHLQELYQINETANTLSILLQAQAEQKENFKTEIDQARETFEQEMRTQKTHWQEQRTQLEKDFKEWKIELEKTRKRDEEDYSYALNTKRRKEIDEYNNKRIVIEKELSDLKDNLLKREADLLVKEQNYDSLKLQVESIPTKIKEAVTGAEELLRKQLLQQYKFENQLNQKEYDGILKLKEQSIGYLEEKIEKQEIQIKELTEKTDAATQQVRSIACKALDTSAWRFATVNSSKTEEKNAC